MEVAVGVIGLMRDREEQLSIWWDQYKETGDAGVREQLILSYLHLVKYAAGRVAIGLPATVDHDDLVSYGVFGLLDAIDKFDHARGVKFESYALVRIRGAILDGLRAVDWVPRSVRRHARELSRTMAQLESQLGRPATDEEMRAALDLTPREYGALLQDVAVVNLLSLEEPIAPGESGEERLRLIDMLTDGLDGPAAIAEREAVLTALAEAIEVLPERERLIITLYYYEGLTLKEIGGVIGVTESRISQLHTKALSRLRGKLERLEIGLAG